MFTYNGLDSSAIEGAIPAMKMLMSWVPAIVTFVAAATMLLYLLTREKMTRITLELKQRRITE